MSGVQAVSSANQSQSSGWVDNLLKQNGINAKKQPFRAYYFLVMVVMRGMNTNAKESNMDKFAGELKGVTNNTNAWNQFKSAFDNVGAAVIGNEGSSKFDSADNAYYAAAGNLLNQVFGKYMASQGIPPFGSGTLDQKTVGSLLQNVQTLVANAAAGSGSAEKTLAQCFPVLGKNVGNLATNISALSNTFTAAQAGAPTSYSPSELWLKAINASSSVSALPDPQSLQPYEDAFSEGEGTLSGVGGAESSKLQMAQQSYNQLQSVVKSLMSDWVTQRKSFNSSMSQAGS
ncbi:MAG: hypothetical protein P0S95_02110 [Rhabdochlamydiaceae bacterium]|nr:hypothetical protein [Candidatus Amphrikana amoebophyrae]